MSDDQVREDTEAPETPEAPKTPETPEMVEQEEDLLTRLMRLQAEFENYRKRSERERREWGRRAVEGFVLDLLPALDSFDRALEAAPEAGDPEALLEGLELVLKQLRGALKANGVESFDALGEPFDPNLHEAFLSRPPQDDEVPGTVVMEYQKGYRMGDRTIRPTKGVVAAWPEEEAPPEEDAGPGSDPEEE